MKQVKPWPLDALAASRDRRANAGTRRFFTVAILLPEDLTIQAGFGKCVKLAKASFILLQGRAKAARQHRPTKLT
jgi:hypothetical protein